MSETSSVSLGSSEAPHVVSIYDGFFSGGARILHTDVIRSLATTTNQTHSVLSLHDEVSRESTIQRIENDTCYKRLSAAGLAIRSLRRRSDETGSTPYSAEDETLAEFMLSQADIILTLKEQPLSVLDHVDIGDTPLITCLHRSDPEHQGGSLDRLVSAHELGQLTAAICCARSTQKAYHEATGIPLNKLPFVQNGVNLFKFKPSEEQRFDTRLALSIPDDAPMILFAARFDKMKNVPLFIKSAAEFARYNPQAHYIVCGAGMTDDNESLRSLISTHMGTWDNLDTNLHLLGIVLNMPPLYAATDIVALTSSFGEAAPLCLLEGMASGAIPVTTDVGDSARIVRNPDLVTSNDPFEIAQTWAKAYESREFLRHQIMNRRSELSSERTFDKYHQIITRALNGDILELGSDIPIETIA